MELYSGSLKVTLWISILVLAVSLGLYSGVQPVFIRSIRQVSNSGAQSCIWNSTKSIEKDVEVFVSCFLALHADRLDEGGSGQGRLPECVAQAVSNFSTEVFLLKTLNVSDHDFFLHTRDKMYSTFADLEACVMSVTDGEECQCFTKFSAAVLSNFLIAATCIVNQSPGATRYLDEKTVCQMLSSGTIIFHVFGFICKILGKIRQRYKAMVIFQISAVVLLHFGICHLVSVYFSKLLVGIALETPLFGRRVVHVDFDQALGRDGQAEDLFDFGDSIRRYPGEDAMVACHIVCKHDDIHQNSTSDPNEQHVEWFLNEKRLSFSKRRHLLFNRTTNHGEIVQMFRIHSLQKSDFGRYRCRLYQQIAAKCLKLTHQFAPREIREIQPVRVERSIPPGSVLRIRFSYVSARSSVGSLGNFTQSVNGHNVAFGDSRISKNMESCSVAAVFLDIVKFSLSGSQFRADKSSFSHVMTSCVSFPHYGVHHIDVQRLVRGKRAATRHPVTLEVTRQLGARVASGQSQQSDEDLQSAYTCLREFWEILLLLGLLELNDVILLFYTAVHLKLFALYFRPMAPFWIFLFSKDHANGQSIYVVFTEDKREVAERSVVNFLERSGHHVYCHHRDCPLGTAHVGAMSQAIPQHQKFLMVISRGFLEDPLCPHQREMILEELRERETSGSDPSTQLLFVRSDDADIPQPTLGAPVVHWNLSDEGSASKARQQLLAWMHDCLFPGVKWGRLFRISAMVTFCQPMLLILVPYWPEIKDIFANFFSNIS